ncbi:DUF4244 domain-containing protein [Neoactinobaculum massilliense]|uniref:DUF4244 domain-containing protein n=1 Tax=Neoactinobaculum massilliense TaxID=2364794 RepID=UPI000F5210B2|nr:DUF4244 domain-containing protein [Neoactinobaculum massilliense]
MNTNNLVMDGFENPEAGMTTAEYAVGTVGASGIAGIILWLANQDWFRELFANLFRSIFKI